MIVLTVLSALGSLASLVALGFYFFQNDATKKAYVLLAISFLMALSTGVLSYQVLQLSEENKNLLSAKSEARELLRQWNLPSDFSFVSRGKARGVVISGLIFLEMHKDQFPEQYENASAIFKALGIDKNRDEQWWDEIGQLQQAAETMQTIILAAQIKPTNES
jgi:hypothetical protein